MHGEGTCVDCGGRTHDRAHTRCRSCWKKTAAGGGCRQPRACKHCGAPVLLIYYPKKQTWYAPSKHDDCFAPGRAWKLRKRLLKDRCDFCGFVPAVSAQLQLDHRVPRSKGGTNLPSNLQTLCANCHALKTYIEQL